MALNDPPNVPTVKARILPGWMSLAKLTDYLTKECEPAFSPEQAAEAWRHYRQIALSLPENRFSPPQYLPLTPSEQLHANQFMRFLNSVAKHHDIETVVKVNLRDLVVTQHYIVMDQSEIYSGRNSSDAEWLAESLPTSHQNSKVDVRFAVGPPHNDHPLDSCAWIDLPHAEFTLQPDAKKETLAPSEFMRHMTVSDETDRAILTAGYHRAFARLRNVPN